MSSTLTGQSGIASQSARAGEKSIERTLVAEFVGRNDAYYARQFKILEASRRGALSINWASAIFGPVWFAARGFWGWFWVFLVLETSAIVQISRGLWSDLGGEHTAHAQRLIKRAEGRLEEAQIALDNGNANAEVLMRSAESFEKAAVQAQAAADAANAMGPKLLFWGVLVLLILKVLQGGMSNLLLDRRFVRWRAKMASAGRIRYLNVLGAVPLMLSVYLLVAYRFTVSAPPAWLVDFPSSKAFYVNLSNGLDDIFNWLTLNGSGFFDSIRHVIHTLLTMLELVLVDTPWPVVMLVIVGLAWRLAGPRVAVFTTAALAYLALLGFWEQSMATMALLGAASLLCVIIGIPLGVWAGRNANVYNMIRPTLDIMQTVPSFVYLIPVIAFFGTGKTPGIIGTVIFGMPPVVRLTALGIQGVPATIREAALAFGASRRFILTNVDLPLAMPSIMAGVNQTILMCLSMVVIAALIGAKGLGESVLEALQYGAQGQGIVAGIAILCCAMILDRIVQGKSKSVSKIN